MELIVTHLESAVIQLPAPVGLPAENLFLHVLIGGYHEQGPVGIFSEKFPVGSVYSILLSVAAYSLSVRRIGDYYSRRFSGLDVRHIHALEYYAVVDAGLGRVFPCGFYGFRLHV